MDGFKMVFDAVNANGGIPNLDGTPSGRMIEIVPLDNQGNTTHGPVVLADAMQGNHSDILVVLLALASRYTVPLEPVLAQYNLSIIGPVTGESLYYNTYDPRFINLVPSADSEVLGLLRFLVVRKKLKRIAIMQPYNLDYGQSQKEFAVKLLKQLDMEFVDVFWLDHPTLTFYDELGELLAAKPQGLLFYGPLSTSSATALGVLLQSSSTLVIAVPVATSALLDSVLQAVPSSLVNDRLYAGSYAPHHRDTSNEVVRSFLATAGATPSLYFPLSVIKAYDVIGSLSFIGYLHARFVVEVLRRNVNVTDRNQFRAQLLDSSILSIDDIFYGVYSGTCRGSRVSLCECNNGAHSVYFNKIETNRSYTALPQETVNTPIESCREENLKIPSPLLQLQVLDTDGGITTDLSQLLSESDIGSAAAYGLVPTALLAAANSVVDSSVKYPVLDHVTRSSDSEVLNPVLTLANDYTLTVIAGSLTKHGVQNTSAMRLQSTSNSTPLNIATVDDLTLIPYRTTTFESHTVRITSTMEQDIHALASYAASASLQVGLLSSASIPDASYFIDSLRRSAVTFGTSVGVTELVSTSSVSTENPISNKLRTLSTNGVLLVLGLELTVSGTVTNLDDAVVAVGEFLTANSEAHVALPLSSLMPLYSHLVTLLTQTQLQRVLVATNLPRWGSPRFNLTESNATDYDPSSLSESSTYFTTVPTASRSPTVMWHFITQKFINSVVERVSGALTSNSLLSSLYLISSFVVEEGLTVGPFYNKVCGTNEIAGLDSCETNAGARLVFVHTLAGAMSTTSAASDASVKPAYQFKMPNAAVEYISPSEQKSSVPTTVIAVASVVGGVLLIVLIGGLIFFLCCVGRRNAAAPKDETKPFTIAFTDIQSSTSLWAEVPEVMAPSLDLHHSAIRSLISKYSGYEVKTIGDSFMVAFASPTNALQFGLAIQQVFYSDVKWPGNGALDTMYIQFDETRMSILRETPTEVAKKDMSKLSIELDPETYRSAWNGLRVRVGLHCGFGEIKKDEVSGGYDYYGSVVNAAARVESVAHGGQVVATKDVIEAMALDGHSDALGTELVDDESPTSGLVYFSLGMVPLRGVPHPVELFQFCHFQHRQFPSLRIDHVGVLDDDGIDNDIVLDDIISLTSAPSGRAEGPVFLDASQLDMSLMGGISPRKMSDTSHTQSSEDRGKQGYTKRISKLVRSGNTYLETLLSALPIPARESMIKLLSEKWRIRLVSKEKFIPMHAARMQKVKETMAPRKGSDTNSVGSRHSVNETQMKKLQKYLDDNADIEGAFKSYQLQAISKRIAPVVAAKEDKSKSTTTDTPHLQVFGSVNQSVSANPSASGGIVNFGLEYAGFNASRLGSSGVTGLGKSKDAYNPYSPISTDGNEGSVRVTNGDSQHLQTYMRPVGDSNGRELFEDSSEWLASVRKSLDSSCADSTVVALLNMPTYLHLLVQAAMSVMVDCDIRMFGYREGGGAVELMGDTLPNLVDTAEGLYQLRMVFTFRDVDGLSQWKEVLIVSGSEEEVRGSVHGFSVATGGPAIIIVGEDVSDDGTPLEIPIRPTILREEVTVVLCRSLEAIGVDIAVISPTSQHDDIHALLLVRWLDSERRTSDANKSSTFDKHRYDQLEMELIQERNRRKTREDVIALCSASASREEECHDLVRQVDEYKATVESLTSRLLSAEAELEASERSRALLAEELKTKSEALLSLWRTSSPGQRSNYLKGSNVDVSGDTTVEHITLKSELANMRADLAESYADLAQSHSRCQQLEQVLGDTESALQTKCLDFESLLMLQESSEDRISVLEQQVELLYQEMDGHYSRNLGLEKEINVASKRVSSTQEEYNKLEMKAADLALQLEAAVGELKNEKRIWEQSCAHISVPESTSHPVDPTPYNNASPNVPTSESPSFERTTSRRGDAPRSSSVSKARTPLLGMIIRDVDGRVRPGASALSKLVTSDAVRGPRRANPINSQRLSPKRAVEVPKLVRGVPPPPSLKDVRQKPKV